MVVSPAAPPLSHSHPTVRHRAAAMPPEERRAAIVAATLPLLMEHGGDVTTRQIAEAAGIAEGTIFRAFHDKESLFEAAVDTAFDPQPVVAALEAIDADLPLERRLIKAVEILQKRSADIWRLLNAVGVSNLSDAQRQRLQDPDRPDLRALASIIQPDRAQLRRKPMAAAQLLRSLTLAGSHPTLIVDKPLTPAEIVSVLLDGIRNPC